MCFVFLKVLLLVVSVRQLQNYLCHLKESSGFRESQGTRFGLEQSSLVPGLIMTVSTLNK